MLVGSEPVFVEVDSTVMLYNLTGSTVELRRARTATAFATVDPGNSASLDSSCWAVAQGAVATVQVEDSPSSVVGSTGLPTGGTTGQALVKNSNTNGDVGWATVSAAANALGLLNFRGAWQATTSYAAGDVVIDPSSAYPQLVVTPNAQTSGASYAQGASSASARWVKIGTRLPFLGAWAASTYYPAGSLFVEPGGTLRESALDHTSAASYDSTKSTTPRYFETIIGAATVVPPANYLPAYHQPLVASPFRMSFAPIRQRAPVKRCATWTTSTGWSVGNGSGAVTEDTSDFQVPDRAIVCTQTPTTATFYTPPTFASSVDMSASGGYVRLAISINDITKIASGSGNLTIRLYSGGAATGSNYLETTIAKNNETWLDGGEWKNLTIAITDFTTVGTGVTLSAITNVAFVMKATTSPLIVRLQYIDFCVSQVTKAKVVLWFDDYIIDEAIRQMAPYGFPGVAAVARADFETGGGTVKVQRLRYLQDMGWQIAAHSYSMAEHGSVHGDALTAQFAKTAAFDAAYGINGGVDYAVWGNGPLAKGDDRIRIRSHYRSGRWNQSGPRLIETMAPAMPELTRAWLTASGETSATNWQPWVTQAINAKGLAQFVWHPGNLIAASADATQFGTFLAWLATQSVDVVTADEAWRSLAATS